MKVIENIRYSSIGHERQVLDLYLPDCEEFPVFVYFHGGGFQNGAKGDDGNNKLGVHLASKGIACVCANYRLYPDAVFPDFVKDAAAVVGWTFKHIAEYGNQKAEPHVKIHCRAHWDGTAKLNNRQHAH